NPEAAVDAATPQGAPPPAGDAGLAGDLTALPFDQYQRYRILKDAIDALRWQPRLSVLDVGGSPGTLKAFLPDDWVVVADVADQGGLDLYASGLALPFADRAFDVVTACDTLEHVPAAERPAFLAQ